MEQLTCIAPRGKYDVEMTHSFMKMKGGTNQFMIQFSNVVRLFCLPRPDNRQYDVVISVHPPLRHGFTPHFHIVFHFDATESLEVALNLTEEELRGRYDGKLSQLISGEKYKVVCKLLKTLTGITVTVPGSFRSSRDDRFVRCSLRANEGSSCLDVFAVRPCMVSFSVSDILLMDRTSVSP